MMVQYYCHCGLTVNRSPLGCHPGTVKVRDACSNHAGGTTYGDDHLEILHSPALKLLKKEVGQVNQQLITIFVGLDGIIPHSLSPNPGLHTTWNPQSKEASVDRSKLFAKKAVLVWLVDCIDMYLRIVNQAPLLFLPEELKCGVDRDENSRSVYKRINLICDYYNINSVNSAFVDLLIGWRNKVTHFQADNDISPENRLRLLENHAFILTDFCGLDVTKLLEDFDAGNVPTFKEVTSLTRASINFAYELDNVLLCSLNLLEYADRILVHHFCSRKKNDKNKCIDKVFSKDVHTKERMIKQILMQNGFSVGTSRNDVDSFCEQVSRLSYKEAVIQLEGNSFLERV